MIDHNRYVSNQGSYKHGTDDEEEVIQVAPGIYGAVLALPYNETEAIGALREYINLGFYNQYLGFPDNIQLTSIKGLAPVPSWKQIELNMGPIALAIDSAGDNIISELYRSSRNGGYAYQEMLDNFNHDSGKSVKTKEVNLALTEDDNPSVDSGVLLYPNPVSNELNLRFSVNKASTYQVMIVNLLGEVVLDKKLNLNEGISEVQLTNNIRSVCKSNGLYLIGVKGLEVQKIMKLLVE